jgi:hypothetical protein
MSWQRLALFFSFPIERFLFSSASIEIFPEASQRNRPTLRRARGRPVLI